MKPHYAFSATLGVGLAIGAVITTALRLCGLKADPQSMLWPK